MKLRRLLSNNKGSAAVEFALLSLPTIGLVFISLQTAVIFFFDQNLQTSTKQAARLIMTGNAQTNSLTQAAFATAVSNASAGSFAAGSLVVDVQSASSFTALSTAPPVLTYTGNNINARPFHMGGPGDAVIVRVMYRWPVVGGPLGIGLANQPDGSHLLISTVVFKNEPYA